MRKNTIHTAKITALSSEGNGIARLEDGYTVFVRGGIVGDTVRLTIIKENKSYGIGKITEVVSPSESRIAPACDFFLKCGGCDFLHMNYAAQLEFKEKKVCDAFLRIGHFEGFVTEESVPSPTVLHYRNKAQYPVCEDAGEIFTGFYAPRSHRVVKSRSCFLQNADTDDIKNTVTDWATENKISAYNEQTGKGILRKICIRRGKNEACVTLVCAKKLPKSDELCRLLTEKYPFIVGIVQNINSSPENTIYSDRDEVLYGRPYIYDDIGSLKFKINYRSFFQVNPHTTRLLYDYVRSLVSKRQCQAVLDLYCGAGTIGLYVASCVREVIGVEIVPAAVNDARENARTNNLTNASFYCGSAQDVMPRLVKEGKTADCVILDPPRKGCEKTLIDDIASFSPSTVIYVSCDCATAARDAALFAQHGYSLISVKLFDQFPQTCLVETVALLVRGEQ